MPSGYYSAGCCSDWVVIPNIVMPKDNHLTPLVSEMQCSCVVSMFNVGFPLAQIVEALCCCQFTSAVPHCEPLAYVFITDILFRCVLIWRKTWALKSSLVGARDCEVFSRSRDNAVTYSVMGI